jgi:hypothetical protein
MKKSNSKYVENNTERILREYAENENEIINFVQELALKHNFDITLGERQILIGNVKFRIWEECLLYLLNIDMNKEFKSLEEYVIYVNSDK